MPKLELVVTNSHIHTDWAYLGKTTGTVVTITTWCVLGASCMSHYACDYHEVTACPRIYGQYKGQDEHV